MKGANQRTFCESLSGYRQCGWDERVVFMYDGIGKCSECLFCEKNEKGFEIR